MTPREELQQLRDEARLVALEARARGGVGVGSPAPAAPAPAASQTFQRAGGYGAGSAGVNEAVIKGALGLKQLVGLGSDNDKAVLEQIRLESEADPNSGLRTTGNIAGNLVMSALPGGAAAKGIQGMKALSAFPKLASLLAAGGSSAATEFALAPGEGGSYGEQLLSKSKEAAKAAAMGAGITAGIGAVAKPLSGLFKAKPEAEALYRQGINPTLQQGAAGTPGRLLGGLTAGVQNLKTRWNDEVGDALLRKSTEGNVSLPAGTGEDFATGAKTYVQGEYDKLWSGKKIQLSPRHREAIVSRVGTVPSDGVGVDEAAQAARLMANRMGVEDGTSVALSNHPYSPEGFREKFRKPISDMAFGEDNPEIKRRLLEGRDLLDKLATNKSLTKPETARLKEINSLNFDANRMEEAAQGGRMSSEGLDISRLNRAYERMLKQGRSMENTTYDDIVAPANRVMSSTPNQNTARSWKAAMARTLPIAATTAAGALGGSAAAIPVGAAYGLSLLGQTGPGAKALMGQYGMQKSLAELVRKYAAQAGGVSGPALTNQEDSYAP